MLPAGIGVERFSPGCRMEKSGRTTPMFSDHGAFAGFTGEWKRVCTPVCFRTVELAQCLFGRFRAENDE